MAHVDRSRGLVQRSVDGVMVALGGLTVGFMVAAAGSAERWTVFGLRARVGGPFDGRAHRARKSPNVEANEGQVSCTGFLRSSPHPRSSAVWRTRSTTDHRRRSWLVAGRKSPFNHVTNGVSDELAKLTGASRTGSRRTPLVKQRIGRREPA